MTPPCTVLNAEEVEDVMDSVVVLPSVRPRYMATARNTTMKQTTATATIIPKMAPPLRPKTNEGNITWKK